MSKMLSWRDQTSWRHSWRYILRRRTVSLDRLLWGGDNGLSAAQFSQLTGQLLRPSTPLAVIPHVQLLQLYERIGEEIFEPDILEGTPYYQNARVNIEHLGHFFDACHPRDISQLVRRFVEQYSNKDQSHLGPQQGQSPKSTPIRVRPIKYSDCYEIVDGHHRLAIALMNGVSRVQVVCQSGRVFTPLQSMLLNVSWLRGRRELYQPIAAPELQRSWTVVRKCTDRLKKMQRFLKKHQLMPRPCAKYLDIGSSYGWFVAEMCKLGFRSFGVERDRVAADVGQVVYGVKPDQVHRLDCIRFLQDNRRSFNVTSCFSVLHHLLLCPSRVSAQELIGSIDAVTRQVLFLDTGQNHEDWCSKSLPEWNADYIEEWLKHNTSFRSIHRLGVDEDAVPPFEKNYSRMLFACLR